MNTGDKVTISGVFTAFSDGHLLIVPTNEMPFTKTPKKILYRWWRKQDFIVMVLFTIELQK